jgi:hypothetical protein
MKQHIEDTNTWLNRNNPQSQKIKCRITQIFLFFAEICKKYKTRRTEDEEEIPADDQEEASKSQPVLLEAKDMVINNYEI